MVDPMDSVRLEAARDELAQTIYKVTAELRVGYAREWTTLPWSIRTRCLNLALDTIKEEATRAARAEKPSLELVK